VVATALTVWSTVEYIRTGVRILGSGG
jgi:hypothetical protein